MSELMVVNPSGKLSAFSSDRFVGKLVRNGVDLDTALNAADATKTLANASGLDTLSTETLQLIAGEVQQANGPKVFPQPVGAGVDLTKAQLPSAVLTGGPVALSPFLGLPLDLSATTSGASKTEVQVQLGEPIRLRTVTRKDCEYKVISRRSSVQALVKLLELESKVETVDIESSEELKRTLSEIIRSGIHLEIQTALGLEGKGASASSTTTTSLSAEKVDETVDEFVTKVSVILTHYTVTFRGKLELREVWTVREEWGWVGRDCEGLPGVTGQVDINEYSLQGPTVTLPFTATYHVYDLKSPRVESIGEEAAVKKAKARLNGTVRGGAFLPEVPPPDGLPQPLHF